MKATKNFWTMIAVMFCLISNTLPAQSDTNGFAKVYASGVGGCKLFTVWALAPNKYVVARVKVGTMPLEEDELRGDFDGFGERSVVNTSRNFQINIELVYQNGDAQAALREMANRCLS
jgi:hypothetical protein